MAERIPGVKNYRDALKAVISANMEYMARAPTKSTSLTPQTSNNNSSSSSSSSRPSPALRKKPLPVLHCTRSSNTHIAQAPMTPLHHPAVRIPVPRPSTRKYSARIPARRIRRPIPSDQQCSRIRIRNRTHRQTP